jgi:hypothetical protein
MRKPRIRPAMRQPMAAPTTGPTLLFEVDGVGLEVGVLVWDVPVVVALPVAEVSGVVPGVDVTPRVVVKVNVELVCCVDEVVTMDVVAPTCVGYVIIDVSIHVPVAVSVKTVAEEVGIADVVVANVGVENVLVPVNAVGDGDALVVPAISTCLPRRMRYRENGNKPKHHGSLRHIRPYPSRTRARASSSIVQPALCS